MGGGGGGGGGEGGRKKGRKERGEFSDVYICCCVPFIEGGYDSGLTSNILSLTLSHGYLDIHAQHTTHTQPIHRL